MRTAYVCDINYREKKEGDGVVDREEGEKKGGYLVHYSLSLL